MKILVIRRDNIGDLVCTTPLLAALKDRFPAATLHVLANSYTAEVLRGHPAVDEVFGYVKAKHRMAGTSLIRLYADRAALLWKLNRERYDYVLVAEPRCARGCSSWRAFSRRATSSPSPSPAVVARSGSTWPCPTGPRAPCTKSRTSFA